MELRCEEYSKTRHRVALKRLLRNRTDGSIEWKHQNISAALLDLGFPYIPGYKPRRNYQRLLWETVADRLAADRSLAATVQESANQPVPEVPPIMIPPTFDDPPIIPTRVGSRTVEPAEHLFARRQATHIDYLARESRNRSLGLAGELLVLQFEMARLMQVGAKELAARIEHISRTRGDGLGFDIQSYEPDGRERFIEVKTTSFGKETPFFVTRNELACSEARTDQYYLYRVFTFRRDPRLFALTGALSRVCRLEPTQYLGRVA